MNTSIITDIITDNTNGTVTEADTGTVFSTTTFQSSMVLVCLSVGVWSAEKTDDEATAVVEADAGMAVGSKEGGTFRKVLMKNSLLSAIKLNRQRATVYNKGVTKPWNDCGERIMPQIDRLEHKAKIQEYKDIHDQLVSEFEADYHQYITAESSRLQKHFKQEDYPSLQEIRSKFHFDVTYSPVPDAGHFLTDLGSTQRAEMIEQFNASANRRIRNVIRVVTGEFVSNLRHIVERLTDTVDENGEEKKSRLFKSLFTNTENSIATLRKMNITNDPELFAAADELERVMGNTDISELKNSTYARQDTKAKVKAIMDKFDF
jgi:hypothetical protein